MNRLIGVKAFNFLYPVYVGVLPMIHDQLHECQRLKQGHPTFEGFIPNTVHDITLQTKLVCENRYNDRCFTITGKPEYDAFGLEQHRP